jgi:hypothetical protein
MNTCTSPTANVVITATMPICKQSNLANQIGRSITLHGRLDCFELAAFAISMLSNGPQPPSKSWPQLVLAVTRVHGFPRQRFQKYAESGGSSSSVR